MTEKLLFQVIKFKNSVLNSNYGSFNVVGAFTTLQLTALNLQFNMKIPIGMDESIIMLNYRCHKETMTIL